MNGTDRWRHGRIFLVLMLVLGGALAGRASEAGNFEQGNERYGAGDYAGAARAYEAQAQSGRLSANLFYNLGDAYFRAGDKGRAVLNYRRALALEPAQSEAGANLAFVTGGKNERGQSGEADSYRAAGAWAAAGCGWLGAGGLLLIVANRRRRTAGIVLAATGFVLCAVGVGSIRDFAGGNGSSARAVVVAEATPALYSPVENAKLVTTLAAGEQVRILSEQGAWTYVLLGDGKTLAWVATRSVERFVPR